MLADNGYNQQSLFMCPWKTPSTRQELLWSEWTESIHKDVECFFGLIKARWWYLRNGIRFHSAGTIQNAFKTAAILHNMLMAYDGLVSEFDDSTQSFRINLNPDLSDVDAMYSSTEDGVVGEEEDVLHMPPPTPSTIVSMFDIEAAKSRLLPGPSFIPCGDFNKLRGWLVTHFSHQNALGDIWWPRSMKKTKRLLHPIPDIMDRVDTTSLRALYHIPSQLRVKDRNGQTYTSTVGDGLFTSIGYHKNDIIAYYNGSIITHEEYATRNSEGRGGYAIRMNNRQVLDCYDQYEQGKCLASYANSVTNARYSGRPLEYLFPCL
jgi:hypothetical protein